MNKKNITNEELDKIKPDLGGAGKVMFPSTAKKPEVKNLTETKVRVELIKRGMNHAGMRYLITKERLEKMPVKTVSEGVIHGKMKSIYFNPVYFYPKGVRLLHNEVGHDRVNRYTLKKI